MNQFQRKILQVIIAVERKMKQIFSMLTKIINREEESLPHSQVPKQKDTVRKREDCNTK